MEEEPSIRLTLVTDFGAIPISCDGAAAPATMEALLSSLPATVYIHTPKIAGNHIYWHAPFIRDLERPRDVMEVAVGAFIYWPERQFLELVFAPLQAEVAKVTYLGAVDCDLESLVALGTHARAAHGVSPVVAKLAENKATPDVPSAVEPEFEQTPLSRIAAVRRELWREVPPEFNKLMAGRGIMHPAGPLFVAESGLRCLHELLWRHRSGALSHGGAIHRLAAAEACSMIATKLDDFCHLPASATAIRALAEAFGDPDLPTDAVLEEAILTVSKLSDWLDLLIPWNEINETVRSTDERRAAMAVV